MLSLSRKDIIEYLDSIGQEFVTDSSNLIDDVLRNKIRLRILPLLEEIAPGATANIDKTATYLCEAEKMYQMELDSEYVSCVHKLDKDSQSLSIADLLALPSPSTSIREIKS